MKKYIFGGLLWISVFSITYIIGNKKNIEDHKKLQKFKDDLKAFTKDYEE